MCHHPRRFRLIFGYEGLKIFSKQLMLPEQRTELFMSTIKVCYRHVFVCFSHGLGNRAKTEFFTDMCAKWALSLWKRTRSVVQTQSGTSILSILLRLSVYNVCVCLIYRIMNMINSLLIELETCAPTNNVKKSQYLYHSIWWFDLAKFTSLIDVNC